jgi:hypothetical protein
VNSRIQEIVQQYGDDEHVLGQQNQGKQNGKQTKHNPKSRDYPDKKKNAPEGTLKIKKDKKEENKATPQAIGDIAQDNSQNGLASSKPNQEKKQTPKTVEAGVVPIADNTSSVDDVNGDKKEGKKLKKKKQKAQNPVSLEDIRQSASKKRPRSDDRPEEDVNVEKKVKMEVKKEQPQEVQASLPEVDIASTSTPLKKKKKKNKKNQGMAISESPAIKPTAMDVENIPVTPQPASKPHSVAKETPRTPVNALKGKQMNSEKKKVSWSGKNQVRYF